MEIFSFQLHQIDQIDQNATYHQSADFIGALFDVESVNDAMIES